MKKRYYILARIAGFLLIALCTVVFLIQIPSVQTRLAQAAVSYLSGKIDADVSIGKIQFVPGNGLLITDIAIIDRTPYTLDRYGKGYEPSDSFFVAGSIKARISLSGLLKGMPLRFRSLQVDDGQMCIVVEPDAMPYLNNLQRIFGVPAPTVPPEPSTEDIFVIKDVQVNNFRFRLKNFTPIPLVRNPEGYGFNWQDLEVFANVTARNLHFVNGIMSGNCDRCEAWTRDGYRIHSVSGDAAVGRGKTLIKDLKIVDDWSNLNLDYFTMTYRNSLAFMHFTDSVSLGGKFLPGTLSFKTLKNIVGLMPTNTVLLNIEKGEVHGPVDNLEINGLAFREEASGLQAHIDHITLRGITDIKRMQFLADIPGISVKSQNVPGFLSRFAGVKNLNLPKDINLDLGLNANGSLDNFDAGLRLATNVGKVVADLNVRNLTNPAGKPAIGADLTATELDAGVLAGSKELGILNLDTQLNAVLGEDMYVKVDSLLIDRLDFKGYSYHGIKGHGVIDGKRIKCRLGCREENLDFRIDATSKGGGYNLNANVAEANLAALGLEELTGMKGFSGNIAARIDAFDKDHKMGRITLSSLNFNKDNGIAKKIDLVNADINMDSCGISLKLASGFLSGELNGKSIEDFDARLDIHDKERLLGFFVPGLYVADNSTIQALRTPGDKINLKLVSPFIGFNENYLKAVDIDVNYSDSNASLLISSPEIGLGGLVLDQTVVRLAGNYETTAKSLTLNTVQDSSYISISEQRWNVSNSIIHLDESGIKLNNFALDGAGGEFLFADGGLSKVRSDTLLVGLSNLDFSLLDDITASEYDIRGKFNGIATVESTPGGAVQLDAALALDDLSLRGKSAGSYAIAASADSSRILANISNTSADGKLMLNALANINSADRTLDAEARFDGFKLNVAQPILNSIFSELDGELNGTLKASGRMDSIQVTSNELELSNALLRVRATNVPYSLNGKLRLSESGLSLERMRINDDEDGSGSLSGKLDFNGFKSPSLKARLALNELKLLGKSDNGSDFYGTAYGSGDILVGGPLSNLNIDVNVSTAKSGRVHVPVGSALAAESKILTFTQKRDFSDEYLQALREKQAGNAGKASSLKINAKVRLQENTEALVEIDKSQGHAITVRGTGDVTVGIDPALGDIELGGTYNITGGRYHFSALSNVATKDFTIQNGSSIKFNGKPLDSQFDITALYTKKASIEPLLASTKSDGGLRTVECGLHIGNRIANPDLKFSINVPDMDPTTKSQVESALNTDDKVQKQFVALVLTGSFIPTEESGVTFNGGNAVFSNLSSVMSSQLNNILQTLNIPVDMGLNYQKSNSGKDIFDVAVSTQLFHNRVILNGSVGNRENATSANGVVGDVDMEVKLNKSGSFRLKLFSHSPDSYTNYLDNTQRNGLGLSFQSEFTYWKTLWRSIVGKKEERERIKRSRFTRTRPLKTILIDE